jgi:hypothetical protein
MNLETRKITFVQEFLKLQNEDLIQNLENLLYKKKTKSIELEITPMSIEQLNEEIDKSIEDADKGRLISVNDLKEKVQKWN